MFLREDLTPTDPRLRVIGRLPFAIVLPSPSGDVLFAFPGGALCLLFGPPQLLDCKSHCRRFRRMSGPGKPYAGSDSVVAALHGPQEPACGSGGHQAFVQKPLDFGVLGCLVELKQESLLVIGHTGI